MSAEPLPKETSRHLTNQRKGNGVPRPLLRLLYHISESMSSPRPDRGRKENTMKSFQKFCEMLNYGLQHDLIEADEAINLMCNAMPLTLHKGEFSCTKDKGGVMCLRKRLVVWMDYYEENKIDLCDLYCILEGN